MELPKIVALGIYDSNIAMPNVSISKKRKVTMFEIELPIENSGISYIDSISLPVNINTIICAKPGKTRHTKFPFKCYYIHITVPKGIIYDILMKIPDFFETSKSEKYKEIFLEMIKHYNNFSEFDDIIIHSKILELIYTLRNDSSGHISINSSSNNTSVIEKTLTYIDENITDDLSLKKLSELNALSSIHFHNIFKSATGKTLRQYVEEQRIKKAITLLLTSNSNLTQIAYDCGFSSQSYFSFAFKRKTGYAPREYMRKMYSKYEL